jgi:hypothetical protein
MMPKIELNLSFALGFFLLIALYITLIFLGEVQERMIYEKSYAKNMDCRVATTQSRGSDFVNKVCGEIPQFGNYRYD